MATEARTRRRYDSPVRRERMGETRERIVAAGVELVLGFTTWDWTDLTFRAVAERAGVGERTVYRHFPTERDLHDAIMAGLATRAGVDYDEVTLSTVADVAGRVFRALGSFAVQPASAAPIDPTLVATDEQRRTSLLRAVASERPDWSEQQQVALAAALDVLWSVPAYERLIDQWGMEPKEAMAVLSWAIGAVTTPSVAPRDGGERPG